MSPLLQCSQSLEVDDIDVPFSAEHSTITYSQHPGQLCVSALAAAHCNTELL